MSKKAQESKKARPTPKTKPKTRSKRATTRKPPPPPSVRLLALIEGVLADGKAEDIIALDLMGKSTMADYMVIATAMSQRQVNALAQNLVRKLKSGKYGSPSIEGRTQGDWVLLDAGDVIVHLFRPEVRAFYNLEKMWTAELPDSDEIAAATA